MLYDLSIHLVCLVLGEEDTNFIEEYNKFVPRKL